MGKSFVETLDAIASPVNLILKYHNMHDKMVTICVCLGGARGIHKALERGYSEQGKKKAMKINITSLIR